MCVEFVSAKSSRWISLVVVMIVHLRESYRMQEEKEVCLFVLNRAVQLLRTLHCPLVSG